MTARRRTLAVAVAIAAAIFTCELTRGAGPEVRTLFPAGGQRGTTVEVDLTGKQETWPVSAWASTPGLSFAAGEKGKLKITIAADAEPGLHWIRVYDPAGTCPPQPFIVGTLTEHVEKEGNNAPLTAETVGSANVVVNGKLGSNGDVDVFRLPLAAGQTLVASLAGHETLGSPMDTVLHVVSPAGQQLAYNHDGRGLDPEVVFTAPMAGDYLVRVFGFPSQPNSTIGFSGSEKHLYRLTLSAAGFIDYPWPLAVTRGAPASIALVGWNIPAELASVTRDAPADVETLLISDARLANVARVRVEPHATSIEIEPNGIDVPQAIVLPTTITGRIADRADLDAYSFEAAANQQFEIVLESRSLGYPLDGVLEITGADGKRIQKIDDVGAGRDPSHVFIAPAAGTYQLRVSDLNTAGSERHVYRLRMLPVTANFEVTASAESFTIESEKPAEITLAIDRRHGFAEEIEFTVLGLPAFVTASPVKSAAEGESAKSVKLTLTSSGGAFSGPIRIQAKSTGASGLARTVTAAIPSQTATLADLWLTVVAPKS